MFVRCGLGLRRTHGFAGAAFGYWVGVFPEVRRELSRWRGRAARIEDERVATLAAQTLSEEHGNLEGSAAFALLAPRARRKTVARAAVAFQALYDFLDTLAELPADDPVANGRRLHQALVAAVDTRIPARDWFAHGEFRAGDGGYIDELIAACRSELAALPGFDAVREPVVEAVERMVDYQAFNHDPCDPARERLRDWALSITPTACDLEWWETAAAAASSLGVFALIALAARPPGPGAEAREAAAAYFPWVGALHVLLDSLVDLEVDLRSGDHSLVSHYRGPARAADRLGTIAAHADQQLTALRGSERHTLIMAAMAAFYLSRPAAWAPATCAAATRVLDALGPRSAPPMALLRARSALLAAT